MPAAASRRASTTWRTPTSACSAGALLRAAVACEVSVCTLRRQERPWRGSGPARARRVGGGTQGTRGAPPTARGGMLAGVLSRGCCLGSCGLTVANLGAAAPAVVMAASERTVQITQNSQRYAMRRAKPNRAQRNVGKRDRPFVDVPGGPCFEAAHILISRFILSPLMSDAAVTSKSP